MKFQPENPAATEQNPQRRFTTYFDLLPGLNRKFGAAMAANRQIKNNATTAGLQRYGSRDKPAAVAGAASPQPGASSLRCTDEAA